MSLSATCESVAQKRTLSSLLAGRVLKKPKLGDGRRLQVEAIQLLEQHQDLSSLFQEVVTPDLCNTLGSQNDEQKPSLPKGICSPFAGSLLLNELKRQAAQIGVSVTVLSARMILERLVEITQETDEEKQEENSSRGMFTCHQRVQLCALFESGRELLSLGALCPKLLWQEYRRGQKLPKLEVVYYLHSYNILSLKSIMKSDEGVGTWLLSQMKALSEWTPPDTEEETKKVQKKVLSTVVGFLVGGGFEKIHDAAATDVKISLLCCSVMDDLLLWVLDIVDKSSAHQSVETGAKLWLEIFDSSLCGVLATEEAVQRFFTHFLTQTLTYKPQLSVSDAISLQNEWTFAKASCCLTTLFRKLAVVFSVGQLLGHLQRVLETHEVNWKHVLCFLSTLLVYEQSAQSSLKDLLSRLLNSAFHGYDLENMITAFLLARQGALEGPAIFFSYSDWFKMSFGSGSGYHANSKKSLVFLLKFLSDLVPFEPPQYLKVHILNPPYVPVKHRSLLMEYVSLAKTRLADLKESVEDMGLYEDVSGAAVQPECQAEQDVEKAVSLFRTTGRISATVMEASIFRRPYFLTRFLPALLKPRLLPVKQDDLMSFIEALKKADKIPAALYSSYLESCQKQRQQKKSVVCLDTKDDPLEVVRIQLQEFTELVTSGNHGEMSAQLSRISHTLSIIFPGCPNEPTGNTVIILNTDGALLAELHSNAVNILLRNFCQCLLNASRSNSPNQQNQWASMFVRMLLGNTQLLSSLMNRLWDLFHNQGSLLNSAHVLGLAVFVVHLQASMSHNPLVQLASTVRQEPIPFRNVLSSALVCSTLPNMLFCVRLCVAAVCYGICAGDSLPEQQQQEFIPSSIFKKLLYLIPRLMPEARGTIAEVSDQEECGLWSSITDSNSTWSKAACCLWRHKAFQQLQLLPQYRLSFSEWLHSELRVQRSEDALSDTQRQEYQQWACMDFYLPLPEEQGGCGGDMKNLCSHFLNAIMDQQPSSDSSPERPFVQPGTAETGSCLPDLLSRLQELIYEMEVSCGHRLDLCDFLFELLSQRCPPTGTSASMSIGTELSLQQTLHTWNRVLPSLPAVLFIRVKTEGERTTVEINKLIEHVNQHQRRVCAPAGLLPSHITAHFLKGLIYACVQCKYPAEELSKVWSHIGLHCPLMLVSTAHWWRRLSAFAFSLWRRLSDGASPPQQLQLLTDCQHWASSLVNGQGLPMPSAPSILLAASLHRSWQSCEVKSLRVALNSLQHQKDVKYKQVLVFLLFFHVNDYLSALLDPEGKNVDQIRLFCTELVSASMNSADWLLLFTTDEQGIYHLVTRVTSDRVALLFPWAFCSLLFQENAGLLQSATRCPGFLRTAILCYISALQLYLDGQTPKPAKQLLEPSHILSLTKQFLLSLIPQTSPASVSSIQLRQLESRCADLDPELSAALSMHLDPHSLSPEIDFL
ncbi:Fanconi anemia group A protein isoform X1 [Oryzias latipes]|uniref:Fanconi anemia group A protein isoform X1 n=1 Tax=Oryzias latipes TaxID=8090 RepID=UPI000CE20D0D|nr:Fanconi anemia group A protein isoform X1 [Oryzias latipes]